MTSSRPRICVVHPLLKARDYQARPQFGQLCSWWKKGGVGVCALVGIGGAGKTALVERFLRVLPEVTPIEPGLDKDPSLFTPTGVFVFSFYDAPNPDDFFAELAAWLGGGREGVTDPGRPRSFSQLLPLLESVAPALLVLDGLEKVQDEGGRGGIFGQIEDARLRDFILRVADGLLAGPSVLITTRFPLFEPLAQRSRFYQAISVETLELEAAVALLRARGVTGSSDDLSRLANSQGLHALTLDLLGGYIARFHHGDASKLPPDQIDEDDFEESNTDFDPDLWSLRVQERRFGRLAQRYSETLSESDPAALALLQRVCLFRMGVDARTLADIFLKRNLFNLIRNGVSGARLTALSERGLSYRLKLLVQMRLLESTSRSIGGVAAEIYTAHPAIRDSFLRSLDPGAVRKGHEAACKNLEALLGKRPGEKYPTDPGVLDLLEEIVHHTIESERRDNAWDIYWDRMGGYRNLGWRLAAYERGERICRSLVRGVDENLERLPVAKYKILLNEWALFLADIGSLVSAADCYEDFIDICRSRQDWLNVSVGLQNLGLVHLSAGRLRKALQATVEAIEYAERAGSNLYALTSCYAQAAHIRAILGSVRESLNEFGVALAWQNRIERRGVQLYSNRGVWYALLLLRLGKFDRAEQVIRMSDRLCADVTGTKFHQDFASHKLVLAELARFRGETAAALELVEQAHDWALARNAQELICWAAIVRSRCELAKAVASAHSPEEELLRALLRNLNKGLHIARSCGFGLHHVELLALKGRAHLLLGEAQAAEDCAHASLYGLTVATKDTGVYSASPLDEHATPECRGIFPAKSSGLPEILAATHPESSYCWGEAEAREVLADSLLLRAGSVYGQPTFRPESFDALPLIVKDCVTRAGHELEVCWRLRIRLGDPGARDTEAKLENLSAGVLVKDLIIPAVIVDQNVAQIAMNAPKSFDVFLSHNSRDMNSVRRLADTLRARGFRVWLDEWELVPGRPWQEAIEEAIEITKAVAVLVGPDGLGPWEIPEMRAALSEGVRRGVAVIPVLLPNAPNQPNLPLFLARYTWVDLRAGLSEEGLNRLQWGITGVKP